MIIQQIILKTLKTILLLAALAAWSGSALRADVFFLESFENYNLGPLDGDLAITSGGVNNFPNGGISNAPGVFFNPWWGSEPPNLVVVTNENGIRPHSGSKMARGVSTNFMTVSQDLYNIGFRVNRGGPFKGNVILDWWFYDPLGAAVNSTNYQDSISLAYYPTLPTNTDYIDPNFFGTAATEQFALGAAKEQSTGFDHTKYQAQVAGSTSAYDGSGPNHGWFNTTATRSIGWHHARITMSAPLPTGTAFVFFYIDNLVNPVLSNNTVSSTGVNAIEMDAGFGATTGYYDDISLDLSQHARLQMTKSLTNIVLQWPGSWALQSSSNAISANFTDVPGATSPYTNAISTTTRLYRLRWNP